MNRLELYLIAMLCPAPVMAGESVNQRIDADADGTVAIEVVRGSVRVLGWDRNEVHVEGTLDDQSEEFIMERRGKVVRIEDQLKSRHRDRGNGTSINVHVPAGSRVRVEVVAAELVLRDIAGPVQADAVSGNIDAGDLGGNAELESVSGRVTLQGGAGDVSLETVSGDIDATTSARQLSAESISGTVQIRNGTDLLHGEFSTVSGNVTVSSSLSPEANVSMDSISGNLTLVVNGEINAYISAETGPGGRILNQLTDDVPRRGRYVHDESLDLQIGSDSAEINATVLSGTITLKRN